MIDFDLVCRKRSLYYIISPPARTHTRTHTGYPAHQATDRRRAYMRCMGWFTLTITGIVTLTSAHLTPPSTSPLPKPSVCICIALPALQMQSCLQGSGRV